MSINLKAATEEYTRAAIVDELEIAKLLNWSNLPTVDEGMRSRSMFAAPRGERGHAFRLGAQPMPRWRRDWDGAGELIGKCCLGMFVSGDSVSVSANDDDNQMIRVSVANHPTKDDAIRYAICKAAIVHLSKTPP